MKRVLSFAIFLSSLPLMAVTPEEAMTFLYSTLSLPDRTDYDEEFYRRNMDATFRAKSEMPWGESVPDREFLHFVVPVRVNNENLDLSREAFYDELKDRVKGLSMKDAILEVNHWCHEKVTYRPSDSRTSSPLSSVSQAIGRCGEESTFTVAALRSVGIPARQIYTPRWAHTDDNHAWVEAWADGEWHFLGACEPEAVLDLAWFNAPASRGLLMNTNVAGDYDGPEEVLLRQPLTTRINVTANYAPVATLPVRVEYPDGSPANGAKVNFCIYNYAEYYPAVTKIADDKGEASLTSGLGDMLVWATDGKKFGFAKGSAAGENKTPLTIVLDKDTSFQGEADFNITPPVSGAPMPFVSPEMRAFNDARLAYEDSIRNAYTSTFITPEKAVLLAEKLGVDKNKLTKVLVDSRGNHLNITECLEELEPNQREVAVDLLMNVSEKDRRDIPMAVVIDHITNVAPYGRDLFGKDKDIFNQYVLNPRIEMEGLTPWQAVLLSQFSDSQQALFRHNPERLVEWVAKDISLVEDENPQRLRMSPIGVARIKKGDALARSIYFVALARTVGIPARIDPVTGTTQYAAAEWNNEGQTPDWKNVDFDKYKSNNILDKIAGISISPKDADNSADPQSAAVKDESVGASSLQINFKPEGYVVDPKYYSQFSLSRIVDGVPVLLEYPEEATVSQFFSSPQVVAPGQYILTTGQRLADGGVLAHSEIFNVSPGEEVIKELVIRKDDSALSVIGSLNAENIYHDIATDTDKSLLSTTGRGYYVLLLASPGHEPSAHALNDISAVKEGLETAGNKIMVLFEDADKASRFDRSLFPGLPSTVVMGIDNNGVSRKEIIESLHLDTTTVSDSSATKVPLSVPDPIIVVADTFNRIVWVSTGYTIGTGDRLLSILRSL